MLRMKLNDQVTSVTSVGQQSFGGFWLVVLSCNSPKNAWTLGTQQLSKLSFHGKWAVDLHQAIILLHIFISCCSYQRLTFLQTKGPTSSWALPKRASHAWPQPLHTCTYMGGKYSGLPKIALTQSELRKQNKQACHLCRKMTARHATNTLAVRRCTIVLGIVIYCKDHDHFQTCTCDFGRECTFTLCQWPHCLSGTAVHNYGVSSFWWPTFFKYMSFQIALNAIQKRLISNTYLALRHSTWAMLQKLYQNVPLWHLATLGGSIYTSKPAMLLKFDDADSRCFPAPAQEKWTCYTCIYYSLVLMWVNLEMWHKSNIWLCLESIIKRACKREVNPVSLQFRRTVFDSASD